MGFIDGDGVAQPLPLGRFDFTGRESLGQFSVLDFVPDEAGGFHLGGMVTIEQAGGRRGSKITPYRRRS